jgi:chorismate--pyruvate lyase
VNTLWQPLRQVRRQQIPANLRAWILDPHSLTQRLRERYGDTFRVELQSQGIDHAMLDERRLLGMRTGRSGVLRQVYLYGNRQPVVYARTMIPLTSLRGELRRVTRLGSRPLGEFLFTKLVAVRARIELAAIPPLHPLHKKICRETTHCNETLWARRSLFMVGSKPLLVLELFLPTLYLSQGSGKEL